VRILVKSLTVEGRRPGASKKRHYNVVVALRAAFTCTLLLSGCSKKAAEQAASSEPAISRQYRQGPVTVIVSVSETNISTAGKIQLMIDVHAPPADNVLFPDIDVFIGPFSVAGGYAEPIQTLANGKQLHRRVWTLVPGLPGNSSLQSIEIQAGSATLKTEPVHMQVTSLLPDHLESFEIRDIAQPVELLPEQQKQQRRWLYAFGAAIGLALAFAVLKLSRRPAQIIVPAPHEAALHALANLPAEELEKIQALTDILLAFIGGRFKLPTSAKTIPEIQPLLPKEIPEAYCNQLEEILVAGEQIRFSNRIPSGFADELEGFVRSFVEEMKETPCD